MKIFNGIRKQFAMVLVTLLGLLIINACGKKDNSNKSVVGTTIDTEESTITEIVDGEANSDDTTLATEEKLEEIATSSDAATEQEETTTSKVEETTSKKTDKTVEREESTKSVGTIKKEEETTKENNNDKGDEIAKKLVAEIISPNMGDFEKALVIHDWMALNIKYDYDNYLKNTIPSSSFSAEGALTTGIAVCDGYAKTFKLLAEKAGLEVNYVYGLANNGKWEGHAWNQVKIEGNWYNVDVTWDDPISIYESDSNVFNDNWNVRYEYFLISDTQMDKDHKCQSKKNSCNSTYDRDKIYSYAAESGMHGDKIVFVRSFNELLCYIDMMGKNNIKDTVCIWYNNSYEDFNFLGASYPVEIKEHYGSGTLSKQNFCISMSEADFSKYPIIQNDAELSEVIEEKFDSGLDSFQAIILDDGDGAISIDCWKYVVELETIVSFSYGRNALYNIVKVGIRE